MRAAVADRNGLVIVTYRIYERILLAKNQRMADRALEVADRTVHLRAALRAEVRGGDRHVRSTSGCRSSNSLLDD